MRKQLQESLLWDAMLNHVYRNNLDRERVDVWNRLRHELEDGTGLYDEVVVMLKVELGGEDDYG